MYSPPNRFRVAIAGAGSLRGKELAAVLEDSSLAGSEMRLLDDEVLEGTLTEAGGEPAVIHGMDEESFEGVRFAFFAGAAALTRTHWRQAMHAGATVIDLSGALRSEGAVPWIPALRTSLPPPSPATGKLFHSPPAATIIACTLASALRELPVRRLAVVFFQPVSERGQSGIDELESQTVNLLSLKPFPQEVFDAQVAFNLLDRYGEESKVRLNDLCADMAGQAAQYLAGRAPAPAIQLIQVPAFYGYTFTAFLELTSAKSPGDIARAVEAAGAKVATSETGSPSNVSVAGEAQIALGPVHPDANVPASYWLWGAADNMRIAAANAVSIAETLTAS
jgi:aspartate-semialdehyde dehydrogenase